MARGVSEASSSFGVEWRAAGGVSFLFLKSFRGFRFSGGGGGWALGYHSVEFGQFPDIS